VLVGVGLLVPLLFAWLVIAPWLKAFLSGAPISLVQLLAMRLRGTPAPMILDTHLALVHSGHASDVRRIESLYIANRSRIVTSADLVEIAKRELGPAGPPGKDETPAQRAAQALKR
jgi:uncharacterized protein YqfA (UPF0365 family)